MTFSFESFCKYREGDSRWVEVHVPWQREFFGGVGKRAQKEQLLKVHPGNQENQGDLVQENVLDANVSFSKKERRTMNKDEQLLDFISA